jgi:undecaprenyl-diphosphatase
MVQFLANPEPNDTLANGRAFATRIASPHSPMYPCEHFMDMFFIFAAKYLFILPIIILGIYFLLRPHQEQKRLILFAVPAVLLAYIIGTIANHLYIDPRPFVVGHFTPLIRHSPDNGFPSDHTLLVSALAAIGIAWNVRIGAVLWAIAGIVATGRVYVGLHHPVDVIGSMLISILAVYLVYLMFAHVWHHKIR